MLPADTFDLDGDGNTTELLPVDQRGRGFPRFNQRSVDIGAFEASCTAITLEPGTLPNARVGVPYGHAIRASGGGSPYRFDTYPESNLPFRLELSTGGELFGTLIVSGPFSLRVSVTDVYGCSSDHDLTLTVTCPEITLEPGPLPNPSVGVPYNHAIGVIGGTGPYSFSATGLPDGLALSTEGVLSGAPKVSGTFTVAVTVTDAYGCGATHTYTLTIADPACGIIIGPTSLKIPYLATVYYQPLSVAPSGQYTVSVSAGTLPPGVSLFAIGHNWFLGGIPTKPGEYTFTLAATKTNSPCAPTRTYTVTVPPTVLPQLTCVVKTGNNKYTARFGYDNSTDAAVTILVGFDNYFTPGNPNRQQTTAFQKGRVTNAFSVPFTVSGHNSNLALWYLRGPDGVRRPVNITTATSRGP